MQLSDFGAADGKNSRLPPVNAGPTFLPRRHCWSSGLVRMSCWQLCGCQVISLQSQVLLSEQLRQGTIHWPGIHSKTRFGLVSAGEITLCQHRRQRPATTEVNVRSCSHRINPVGKCIVSCQSSRRGAGWRASVRAEVRSEYCPTKLRKYKGNGGLCISQPLTCFGNPTGLMSIGSPRVVSGPRTLINGTSLPVQ